MGVRLVTLRQAGLSQRDNCHLRFGVLNQEWQRPPCLGPRQASGALERVCGVKSGRGLPHSTTLSRPRHTESVREEIDHLIEAGRYSPSESLSVPRRMRPKRRIPRWDRVNPLWSIWGQGRFVDFGSS